MTRGRKSGRSRLKAMPPSRKNAPGHRAVLGMMGGVGMLKPKYLEQLPERMLELYSQIEMDILEDMARRIAAQGYFIPAAQWQYQKLIEMGNFHSFIMEALASRTGMTRVEIERLMQEAGQKTLAFDTGIYRRAGLDPPPLAASPGLQATLRAGMDSTAGLFDNLTRTTAATATRQFERALDRAWLQISTGAFDYNSAVRTAIKDLAARGVEAVSYPTGHTDTLEVAVRRAVVTGANATALKLQEQLAGELESDLVETTAHAGARPAHAQWQGKVFSRSGNHPKYPKLSAPQEDGGAGYGTGAGLGGWNCRHSFFPFFEGQEPVYTQDQLEEMNAPKYEYNGQKLTEYEATQTQRGIERNLRRWKREYKAMEAAGQPTEEAAAKLAKWQRTQKDFLDQTGLRRQYDRENVEGFGRGEAARAAKQAALPKAITAPDTLLQVTFSDGLMDGVIPKGVPIEKVRVIAGDGTSTAFRASKTLAAAYGGEPLKWLKKGGIIHGEYFRYDVHWNELNGRQYLTKMKGRKPK